MACSRNKFVILQQQLVRRKVKLTTAQIDHIPIMNTETPQVSQMNAGPIPSEDSFDFNAAACDGLFIGA